MGACLSSSSTIVVDQKQVTSYVISMSGELHQYSVPINVSQVLQSDHASFICSSDRLYFDDFIPSLHSEYQLLPGQIYFMLPASKLQYRLTASDMAALAVKASAALEDLNKNKNKKSSRKMSKKSNSRISPMLLQVEEDSDHQSRQSKSTMGLGVSMRSASVRKLQRLSSRRAKMAVRSFRKLITIQEGSVLS